jgi:hypothetical protein
MAPVSATSIRRVLGALIFLAATMVRAQDSPPAVRSNGLIRLHWDYPAKVSLGFGVIAARVPANYECKTPCLFHGLTVQGAAGIGGGELAVGYGSFVGETGPGTWLIRRTFIGYGVRAAAVRTWGASTLDPQGATYLGIEGAGVVAQFGIRLGVFRRVETVPGKKDWRVFGGAGWSF